MENRDSPAALLNGAVRGAWIASIGRIDPRFGTTVLIDAKAQRLPLEPRSYPERDSCADASKHASTLPTNEVITDPVIRLRAELRRVTDADTYDMLLDCLGTRFKVGALTAEIRLRDFSSPERYTPEGRRATQVAETLLREAPSITVELKGQRSFGRFVGWVWVGDEALGPLLVAAGVATPAAD